MTDIQKPCPTSVLMSQARNINRQNQQRTPKQLLTELLKR